MKNYRPIDHGLGEVLIHKTVKSRWDLDPKYRPKNLEEFVRKNRWPATLVR